MTRPLTRLWIIVSVAITTFGLGLTAHAGVMSYTLTDLGTLPGESTSVAYGINNLGQVVGQSGSSSFIYSGGQMTRLGGLPAPIGINDSGQPVYNPAGFSATAFNNAGTFAGYNTGRSPVYSGEQAATYSNGVVTLIPAATYHGPDPHLILPILVASRAYGINNSGAVVGSVDLRPTSSTQETHPFLYSGGKTTDLGLLPGSKSAAAYAINDAGHVVGGAASGPGQAFLFKDGKLTELGSFGGTFGSAYYINNRDQILGSSALLGDGVSHEFLYENGKMSDLTELVKLLGGGDIHYLAGINDSGQIAFDGVVDGKVHAYLLTPVPEPTTFALAGAVAAILIGHRIRSSFKTKRPVASVVV